MHLLNKVKYYFIDKFDTNNIKKQDNRTIIIYRNYSKKIDPDLIIKLKIIVKNLFKFYLSNNVKLALKLNLDGVYIPSFNKNLNHESFLTENFKIVDLLIIIKRLKLKNYKKLKIFLYLHYLKKIKII